tara:strand:+ start:1089 stop:1277 length:189 start_codon:yes stop_codon:yes gene_type:complete
MKSPMQDPDGKISLGRCIILIGIVCLIGSAWLPTLEPIGRDVLALGVGWEGGKRLGLTAKEE